MNHGRLRTARPVAKLRQGRTDWYRIENNVQARAADVHIYDEIGYFGVSAQDLIGELNGLDAAELTVHINSPGGDVWDGLAILNTLRSHQARVTTIVEGIAASAASFIAQAGDERVVMRNATLMIHDAWGMCIGNATDARQLADELDRASDNIADIYAARSGKGDVASWREQMRAETWFSADEALAAGLADTVRGPNPQTGDDKPQDSWDLSVFNYAGRPSAPAPPTPVEPPEVAPADPEIQFDPDLFRRAILEGVGNA